MEITIEDTSMLLIISQTLSIILLISVIIFGILLILKLFRLMDSQTALNKAKLKALHEKK